MQNSFAKILDLLAGVESFSGDGQLGRHGCCEFVDNRLGRILFIIDDEDDLVVRIILLGQRMKVLAKVVINASAWGDDGDEGRKIRQRFRQLGPEIFKVGDAAEKRFKAEKNKDGGEEVEDEDHGFSRRLSSGR